MVRDDNVDLLRFIGLAMIVLAHISPSPIVFQLRNFDVPLMVLVSGFSFSLTYKKADGYFVKRIKRLVLPTWVFLSGYFLVKYLFGEGVDLKIVAQSYFFSGGIGYVWVIQVFLVVALISPFVYEFSNEIKSDLLFFLVILFLYFLFSGVLEFVIPRVSARYVYYLTNYLLMPIPYILIFMFGMRFYGRPSLVWQLGAVFFGFVFFCYAIFLFSGSGNGFVQTQGFKYPPRIYYISYALFVSFSLVYMAAFLQRIVNITQLKSFVCFCSKNSIWIYLWHIAFIGIEIEVFFAKYLLVSLFSVSIVYFQVALVKWLTQSPLVSGKNRPHLVSIFTG